MLKQNDGTDQKAVQRPNHTSRSHFETQMVEEDNVLNAAVFIHCIYMADISRNPPGQSDMSEI